MKNTLLVLGMLLMGTPAQARAELPTEGTIFDLKPGEGVTRIDVAYLPPVISLRLLVERAPAGPTLPPEARVQYAYGDFECAVQGIDLEKEGIPQESMLRDSYLVRVSWQPGADLSGCLLAISEPYANRLYPVELFMSF